MDAYLTIAQKILKEARRPLSAREILKQAYPSGQMPMHLHGRTQHKTLGARLAENILEHGERGLFFRNAPGRFFLTEFLKDNSIPPEYRRQFVARRRRRQLAQPRPLTFNSLDLPAGLGSEIVPILTVLHLLAEGRYHYPRSTKHTVAGEIVVWSFVIVIKNCQILTYRHGQYREESDKFRHQRAIGFFAPVLEGDRTLFDIDDHGIIKRGLSTISIDLGLTTSIDLAVHGDNLASLNCFVKHQDERGACLLSVIFFESPDWFEPYAKRLAINDLRWLDLTEVKHPPVDLDPWSAAVFKATYDALVSRVSRSG